MNTDGQSSADVRWRIVDLDAKFRAAAKTGILENVFTKERKCLDFLMITSQRNFDADIRNEFKPPRFIWKVAELYQEGKKSRLIDSNWWKKFDKVLEIFDEKFPGSFETHDAGPASPIQSTSNILTASPPPINESRNLPSQTAPSNPQKSKNPIVDYTQAKRTRLPVTTQVKEKEGGVLIPYKSAFKSAPPAPTNKAKPEVEIPLPKTTAPIEIRKTAGKRPPPQRQATPGPSQRPTSQRPTASHEFMESSKSSDSSEEEERIKASQRPTGPGRSKKRPASPQSSSETATEDEEVADKRRKGKGRRTTEDEDGEERHQATAREKKPRKSEKDERDDNGRKIRNLPKATGQLRKKTCSRCDRKELECLVQVGGRACVACAKLKVRCIEVGEEEIPAAKEKPAKKAPAVTFARVIAKKSAPTPTTAPRPEQSAPTPTPAPRPEPVIKSKPRQKTPARPIPPPPPPKKRRQTKKTPKSVETVVNNDGTGSDERPHKKSRTFTELSRGSDDDFRNLEQELTVTKDHLQATNEAMEEMRIQMEEMRVEIEKLRTDVQRYNYNNTELSVRLAKKDEFFFELDDRLLDVEGDLEYVFKRIKTRKRVVIEDQQPVAADQPASEECEAAGAPGSEVTAPMAGQIPAQGSTAAEAPDVTAPMTDQTSAHECEAAEAPEVTAPLSDQTLAPIEDRGLPLDSGSISLEDNVTTTPNASGQINPTALTTAPDGVDEEQVGPSSTDAMAPATVDASGLISDKPSNNTAMPPPPAPVITLEPATPETSQERNATGVSLLAVPKKPADLSRPRSTSRSRSPATASGEPRRSPRGLTPAPLSSQGTSSKRPGDAPENEPPAKKSKADR